jgi:hypothetical protein
VACGYTANADVNAARIIVKRAELRLAGSSGELAPDADLQNALTSGRTRLKSQDAARVRIQRNYIGTAAGVYNTFHHGKDAAAVAGTHMQLIVGDAFYSGACRVDIDRRSDPAQ